MTYMDIIFYDEGKNTTQAWRVYDEKRIEQIIKQLTEQ